MGDETGAPPTRPKEMSLGELVSKVVSYNVQWRRWVYENKDVDEWTFKRKLREFESAYDPLIEELNRRESLYICREQHVYLDDDTKL